MLVDLNRTMFFKSSFDIETEPGEDALWTLVTKLRYWLRGKSMRHGYEKDLPWDNQTWSTIKMGDQLCNSDGTVRLMSSK